MRSKRQKNWVYIALAVFGSSLLIGLWAWLVAAWLQIQNQSSTATDKEKFDASLEVAKAIVAAVGTAATIVGGIVLYLNFRVANKQAELTESRLITERFSKAVEQLGAENGKVAIRLGGIYALERIALDSPRDYWTVMEVLTAFVRDKARLQQPNQKPVHVRDLEEEYMEQQMLELPPEYDNYVEEQMVMIERTPNWNYVHPITVEVQAVLTVLGRRTLVHGFEQYILDLSRTDLRGLLLTGNLEGIKFEETDLRYSILQEATLNCSNMGKSKLERVSFEKVNMRNVDLQGAHLQWAKFSDTKFQAANLENVHLGGTEFHRVDLTQVNLKNANFSNAKLTRTTLRLAILEKASFSDATLTHVNLEGAHLECASFRRSILAHVNLEGAHLEYANLDGANIQNARLESANLEDASLEQANIENVNFRKARLRGSRFQSTTLKQANFGHADLTEAEFLRVDLAEVNFKESDLSMSKFRLTNLSSANLTEANCRKAKFWRSTFAETNLNSADLTYTNFTDSKSLTPEQVRSAFNWDKAIYDDDLRKQLGLSLDYDAKIREELGLPPREEEKE